MTAPQRWQAFADAFATPPPQRDAMDEEVERARAPFVRPELPYVGSEPPATDDAESRRVFGCPSCASHAPAPASQPLLPCLAERHVAREEMKDAVDPEDAAGTLVPVEWHYSTVGRSIELRWNDESRRPVTEPNARQRAAVLVRVFDRSGAVVSSCSGVIVRQRTVLTAAHCVTEEEARNLYGNRHVVNVRRLNRTSGAQERTVGTIKLRGGGTTWNGSVVDDWAVLTIDDPWDDAPVETIVLSQMSDREIRRVERVHKLGYPGLVDGRRVSELELHTVVAGNDAIREVDPEEIRFRLDASSGDSGGPIYTCGPGEDDCDVGESAQLLSLSSMLFERSRDHVPTGLYGPKIPAIRCDVLAQFDADERGSDDSCGP